MIEEVVFGNIQMPGELFRLIIAFIGVSAAAYYDLFNKKNVPDTLLRVFLAVAFITNLIFYQEQLFLFSLAVALFFSAIGYIFYRVGQLGGADLFVLASVMLLLPIHPSFVGMPFGMPFIFSTMIFAGLLFSVYVMITFGIKLFRQEKRRPRFAYLLMIVPYAIFSYVYVTSILFSPVYFTILTILFAVLIFFLVYKEDLSYMLAEKIKPEYLEPEDVIALELMDAEIVKKYDIKRLATEEEIKRLKSLDVELWVYTQLPPFIPFLLIGMFLALFFSRSLLFM